MNSLFIRFFMTAGIALPACAGMKAHAASLADADAQKVQHVIVAQLKAFADDERQPDASWRIGGCAVSENRWKPV